MKAFLEKWSTFEAWLLEPPAASLSMPVRFVRETLRIFYAVFKDVLSGQISLHAMSLVYTTILSFVPLLALSFSILKAFNVQDKFTPMLYRFLEPMGEKGLEIHNNILSFVDNMKVGVLGVIGFLLLFYTVISLIQKVEKAFNSIWYAAELRSLGQRLTNYLIVVLVGPVLVVSALSITASTMNSSVVQSLIAIEPFGSLILLLTKLTPLLMIILTFTLFYMLMPNTKVKLKSALVGGVIGGSAWQASSLIFTAVVVGSAKYDAIYSGFAVGILLLIWLYVNWLILLLGSSVSFYHQHGSHIRKNDSLDLAPSVIESVGLDMMAVIGAQFEKRQKPIALYTVESMHGIPAVAARKIVDGLLANRLLILAGEHADQLVPARSTDHISVNEILNALRSPKTSSDINLLTSKKVKEYLDASELKRQECGEHLMLRDLINEKHTDS